MVVENFTTYTEVDEGGDISRTAPRITVTSMKVSRSSWVIKSYGAGYFDDFEIEFTIRTTDVSSASSSNRGLGLVGFSNSVGDYATCKNGDLFALYMTENGSSNDQWVIGFIQFSGGVLRFKQKTGRALGLVTRYFTMSKSGADGVLRIYTDSARTSLEDTIALTGIDDAYRYVYGIMCYDGTGDVNDYWSGYVENLDLAPVDPPTVTTQAATNIEDTDADGNGNITATGGENCDERGFVWDLATHGDPGDVAPGASGYANNPHEDGAFGVGAFSLNMPGLPTGDIIYYRAYAHNSAGYDYGAEQNFLTKPAAPTNVQATDGAHTDKVVITWTKSTGATQYQVYRDGGGLGWLGDVATHDDAGADAPTITAGSGGASDGTSKLHVVLTVAGEGTTNGTTHTYKVRARNATGESDDSGTNTGYRGVGALTYQWQRSAGDADAAYGNIIGATTDPYNDTAGVFYPDGRWYRCVLDATGAAQQITTTDRGYKILEVAKTWDADTVFKALGIEETFGADTAIQMPGIEETADVDTAIQLQGIPETFDIDTLIVLRIELQRQLDAAFQLQGIERTAAIDAAFQLLVELQRQVDTAFKLQGIEETFDIDTLIVLRTELQRTIDAAFQATVEKTPDVDAAFQLLVELQRQVDAAFQLLVELQRQVDTAFKLQGIEETFDIDTLIVLRIELQRQVDTAIQMQGIEEPFDIDAAFELLVELQRQINAAFELLVELQRQVDAAFQALGIEMPADYDAAFKLQAIEESADVDAAFELLIELQRQVDAFFSLRVELQRQVDTAIQMQAIPETFGMDVRFVIRRFILTHLTSDDIIVCLE